MITIGGRTKSCEAVPGFLYQELKEEAKGKGLKWLGESYESLLKTFCVPNAKDGTPGILYHRNIAATSGNYELIRRVDLDVGKEISQNFIEGKIAGITSTGVFVFTRSGGSYPPIEILMLSSEYADLHNLLERENKILRIPMYEKPFNPLKVIGTKLVYSEEINPKPRPNFTVVHLSTIDLVTGKKKVLFSGNVFDVSSRGNSLLVETDKPRKYLLFDIPTGEMVWEADGGNFFTSVFNFLISPEAFVCCAEDDTLLYYLSGDEWEGSKFYTTEEERITVVSLAVGMSRGRILLSDTDHLYVYDISDLEKPRLLNTVSVNPLDAEVQQDRYRIFELPDGRIIHQHISLGKEFLIDPDFGVLENVRKVEGEYFLLPPKKTEREKFVDVIYGAASGIARPLAELIERFI